MDNSIQRIQDHIIVPAPTQRERRNGQEGRPFPAPEGAPPVPEGSEPATHPQLEDLPVSGKLPDEAGRRLDVTA